MAKSEITDTIEKTIADFSTILRDVAQGLKNKGFFDKSNWTDQVIDIFGKVITEAQVDDSITDNEHEISNSFVDERSKFPTKSRTSNDCDSITNQTNNDMFDDSNDSFEIPETQPFPPTDHLNYDDEVSGDGYINMPVERVDTINCSQSQVILAADELGQQSPCEQNFQDSDSIDLEMSNLQWDDSAKDADKSKGASLSNIPMKFNCVTNKGATAEYDRSASVTPDLDFPGLNSTLSKSIETVALTKMLDVSTVPFHSDGCETKKDDSFVGHNGVKESSTSSNVTCEADTSKSLQIEKNDLSKESLNASGADDITDIVVSTSNNVPDAVGENNVKETVDNAQVSDDDQLFRMPSVIKENSYDDMPETQLFAKSDETIENAVDAKANDVIDNFDATQLFTKCSADGSVDVSNEADDGYNSILKGHPHQRNLISSTEDDNEDEVVRNNKKKTEITADPITVPSKIRKRNRLIESSDEEDEVNESSAKNKKQLQRSSGTHEPVENDIIVAHAPNEKTDENDGDANTSDQQDDVFAVATQKFETLRPATAIGKCISELKRDDWSELCEKANKEQATVVFKSVFDQSKDLTTVQQTSNVSLASPKTRPNVEDKAPTRQSSRGRSKKKSTFESTEKIATKRQKVSNPPEMFKIPSDLSTSNVVPTPTKKARTGSTIGAESDEVDENGFDDNGPTQVFMKASSTPKESAKSMKLLAKRQTRTVTEKLPEPKAVKRLIAKTSAKDYNQSATYSPKPADVKPKSSGVKTKTVEVPVKVKVEDSADVNENITVPGNQVSSRTSRKRKATDDLLSLSTESIDSTSSRSSSTTRSSRNPNFRVMFTMIDPKPHEKPLKELNITITASSDDCNALITDKIYRTSKFMCALAAGKPIVSINWLNELKKKRSMMDPFDFLLKDDAGEKKYRFNLDKTLREVKKNGRLFGHHSILVTPSCNPAPDILKDIITSGGGKYLKTTLVPRKDDTVLCISDPSDKKLITQLKKKHSNLTELTVEDFMQSIFQYKIVV